MSSGYGLLQSEDVLLKTKDDLLTTAGKGKMSSGQLKPT